MITLDFDRPYSTHDAGSDACTRFMQDGNKFDINGNLLGPDGRELGAIEDVEALFEEPDFIEEVVETEHVGTEPAIETEPEAAKPKSRKPKAKPVLKKAVEEHTEIDELA